MSDMISNNCLSDILYNWSGCWKSGNYFAMQRFKREEGKLESYHSGMFAIKTSSSGKPNQKIGFILIRCNDWER